MPQEVTNGLDRPHIPQVGQFYEYLEDPDNEQSGSAIYILKKLDTNEYVLASVTDGKYWCWEEGDIGEVFGGDDECFRLIIDPSGIIVN